MLQQFSPEIRAIQARVSEVVEQVIAPRAAEVDRDALWPAHSMRALATAGLLGLNVPERLGGLGQGLSGLAAATEIIGQSCSSSALCFGMHCVGTAVIAAKPTGDQEERFLRPIANGKHITTLSLSETGTGIHFYLPQTKLVREGDEYLITGVKQFVTSAGHADSYVVSTLASAPDPEAGEFSCILVERDRRGIEWVGEWHGLGMRGNSARGMKLDSVRVPLGNLLGEEGDQIWYVFEVIAPYFIVAMAGTYLGIAQAAIDYAIEHVRARSHQHSGRTLAQQDLIQSRLAELWMSVEQNRLMLYRAAQLGDIGDPSALVPLLLTKAGIADACVNVTNEAMTLAGGIGYADNDKLSRLLRDARASHVMSPTTAVLKIWGGRALLGLPLLD